MLLLLRHHLLCSRLYSQRFDVLLVFGNLKDFAVTFCMFNFLNDTFFDLLGYVSNSFLSLSNLFLKSFNLVMPPSLLSVNKYLFHLHLKPVSYRPSIHLRLRFHGEVMAIWYLYRSSGCL